MRSSLIGFVLFVFAVFSWGWGADSIVALARVGSVVITSRDLLVYQSYLNPQFFVGKKGAAFELSKEKILLDDLSVMAAAREENNLFKSVKVGQGELAQLYSQWRLKVGGSRLEKIQSLYQISEEEIKEVILGLEVLKRSKTGAEDLKEWKSQLRERYPVQYFSKNR